KEAYQQVRKMEERKCSFCNKTIEPGTGKLYAKKDGTVFFFCSAKCENNVALGRVTRRIKWARKGA
ncbi:MAG TPA: 50S ribosomal protein L24e, partial [Methanothrix soehngenii]|nr:50S ribosomal protein L24e [Methanothrix soehngenii]